MPVLSEPHGFVHSHYADGCQWTVNSDGVAIDDAPVIGTPGEPATARRVLGWFGAEIDRAAAEFNVPAILLAATICAESAGGQPDLAKVTAARRNEPGWVSDASTPSRVSVGCCQTLISTARVALRSLGLTADDLAQPEVSIRAAAAVIAGARRVTGFDPPLVAAAYNAGGLYYDGTDANRWKLRCYPLGTGRHIDRYVAYYNDLAGLGSWRSGPASGGDCAAAR
jgi:Transglycosylase SLT domain